MTIPELTWFSALLVCAVLSFMALERRFFYSVSKYEVARSTRTIRGWRRELSVGIVLILLLGVGIFAFQFYVLLPAVPSLVGCLALAVFSAYPIWHCFRYYRLFRSVRHWREARAHWKSREGISIND